MKLLLDMNIPVRFLRLLAEKGIETVRWSDVGMPNATDVEIMEYARMNGYIVVSCDLDFSAILSITHQLKPSVVQIRASVLHAERAVDLIATAIERYEKDLQKGAILSIDLKNARLRILPI